MTIVPSASLLVLSPGQKILFMKRPGHGSFPGYHVFPGGAKEPDDPSLAYTALRETFEETGLFIGPGKMKPQMHPFPSLKSYDEILCSLGAGKASYDWSDDNSLNLSPISRWITPSGMRKRFETQFYICSLEQEYDLPQNSSSEVDCLEWISPEDALLRFHNGDLRLMPPQYYLCHSLKHFGHDDSIKRLRTRIFSAAVTKVSDDGEICSHDWGNGERGLVKYDRSGNISDIKLTKL